MKMENVITNYNYKNNKLCFFAGLPEIAGNRRKAGNQELLFFIYFFSSVMVYYAL
jgi:hypothetical protein